MNYNLGKLGETYTSSISDLFQDLSEVVSKTKRDSEAAQQALLLRLFPEVKVTKGQAHETWIESFANEVKSTLTTKVTEVRNGGSNNEEVEALEKQVANYKTVLAQTVS